MMYPELVASTVAGACRDEGIEGVRLSPFLLPPELIWPMLTALRDHAGAGLHVAVSSPGAERYEDDTTLVCSDEDAARQATYWRNKVRSGTGERIVYISFKRWGREGGLRDTLRALGESDMLEAFLLLPEEQSLPRVVGAALSGQVRSVRQLCELASEVREAAAPWPSIGNSLPRVGLVKDSAINEANAEERLRLNREFARVACGNQKRKTGGQLLAEMDQFRRAKLGPDSDEVVLDLGKYSTEVLLQELGGGSKVKKKSKAKKKSAKKAKRKSRKTSRTVDDEPKKVEEAGTEICGGPESGDELRLQVLAQYLQVSTGAALKATEQLAKALLDVRGAALEVAINGNPRSVLKRSLPSSAELVASEARLDALEEHLRAGEAAQDRLAALIRGRSRRERASLAGLVRAPVLALFDSDLHSAAVDVLEASARLLEAAAVKQRPGLAVEALLRDTVTLKGRAGDCLLLLGPLHPLWLGQALIRHAQVREHLGSLSPAELRVIARAHQQAPAAPQAFVVGGGAEARLAPPAGGLICFEAQPAIATEEVLRDFGERLVEAYIQVHPYARIGVQACLWGARAPALVEGMARHLGDGRQLEALSIACDGILGDLTESASVTALEGGRLTVTSHTGEPAASHLEIMVGEPPEAPLSDEAADPKVFGISTGELKTEFEVFLGGLRARTAVSGVRGVAEVELALAAASRRGAQGCFTVTPRGFELAAVARPTSKLGGTWSVVLGRHLSRKRPSGTNLLAFEDCGGGLQAAVLSSSAGPAGRALRGSLAKIGVSSSSPFAMEGLANQLERLSRGILTLGEGLSTKLGMLLLHREMQLQLEGGGARCVVTEVEGHHLRALAAVPEPLLGGVCLGIAEGTPPKLVIGYTAVDAALPFFRSRGHLGGVLADFLGSFVEALQAVSSEQALPARCAQEALSWLLFPGAIEAGGAGGDAFRLVQRMTGGLDAPEIEVWIYLPPDSCPKARERTAVLKGCSVHFRPLDNDLVLKVLYPSPS